MSGLIGKLRRQSRVVAITPPHNYVLSDLLLEAAAAIETSPAPTEKQIIDRFSSLSSAAINRIIDAGNEITKVRFEDGVFE